MIIQKIKDIVFKKIYKYVKTSILNYRISDRNMNILWYPRIDTVDDLSREISRCIWYLHPIVGRIDKVVFIVNDNFTDRFLDSFMCPDFVDPNIQNMAKKFLGLVSFIPSQTFQDKRLTEYDIVIEWRRTLQVKPLYPYVVDADILKNQFEANQMVQLCNIVNASKYSNLIQANRDNFLSFISNLNLENIDDVLLIGSGPSLSSINDLKIDASRTLTIACNSVVKNEKIFVSLHPRIVVASDAVFHSGYSKYAAEFREKLIERMEADKNIVLIVPMRDYLLYSGNLPKEYIDKIIGIPTISTKSFNLNILNNYFVKSTSNILTLLMLPLASTLNRKIKLIGFDGRKEEDENIFWQYDKESQFATSYDSTKFAHPAFYRVNCDQYYQKHCDETQQIVNQLHTNNLKISNLTYSYIPALMDFNA